MIPTFHSFEKTRKLIKLLHKQTFRKFDLIIVDCGSDDYKKLSNLNSKINLIFIHTEENLGGSGSYWIGSKIAYSLGYKHIILSDNDAYPISKTLLEELINTSRKHPKWVVAPVEKSIKEQISPNQHLPFHFFLLKKEIIKNVGFPIKDYFIWGDDWEYTNRLRYFGYKPVRVLSVSYYHPTGLDKTKYGNRFYFYVRNPALNYLSYNPKKFVLTTIYKSINSLAYWCISGINLFGIFFKGLIDAGLFKLKNMSPNVTSFYMERIEEKDIPKISKLFFVFSTREIFNEIKRHLKGKVKLVYSGNGVDIMKILKMRNIITTEELLLSVFLPLKNLIFYDRCVRKFFILIRPKYRKLFGCYFFLIPIILLSVFVILVVMATYEFIGRKRQREYYKKIIFNLYF